MVRIMVIQEKMRFDQHGSFDPRSVPMIKEDHDVESKPLLTEDRVRWAARSR